MSKLRIFAKLVRLDQWYKNFIVFLPLVFASSQIIYSIPELFMAFFGFCCISAITYIINDWIDRKKDRLHPIKKERPLASGKVSGKGAILACIILAAIATSIGFTLGIFYGLIIGTYFIFTNLYSLGLKNIPLLDILMVSGNFILRMSAGFAALPNLDALPYFGLLLGIITIFLTHKRRSDIKMLGEKAVEHKPVLKFYTIRNNYIFRAIAYLVVIGSFYMLWQSGLSIYKIIGPFLLLLATSFIFSENPEYTSKPQWLFRSKIWDVILVGNILLFIL